MVGQFYIYNTKVLCDKIYIRLFITLNLLCYFQNIYIYFVWKTSPKYIKPQSERVPRRYDLYPDDCLGPFTLLRNKSLHFQWIFRKKKRRNQYFHFQLYHVYSQTKLCEDPVMQLRITHIVFKNTYIMHGGFHSNDTKLMNRSTLQRKRLDQLLPWLRVFKLIVSLVLRGQLKKKKKTERVRYIKSRMLFLPHSTPNMGEHSTFCQNNVYV